MKWELVESEVALGSTEYIFVVLVGGMLNVSNSYSTGIPWSKIY